MLIFLDTMSFEKMGETIIADNMNEIAMKFRHQLMANGCVIKSLDKELPILLAHVEGFLSSVSPSKAWNILFEKKNSLGISNILHIAELCIVL